MTVGILLERKSLIHNTLHVWQMPLEVSRSLTREESKDKGYQVKQQSQEPSVGPSFPSSFPKLLMFCLNSCWEQRRKGCLCSKDSERNCKIKDNWRWERLGECMEAVWSSPSSIMGLIYFLKCHYNGPYMWALDGDQWNNPGAFIRSSVTSWRATQEEAQGHWSGDPAINSGSGSRGR